MTEFHLHVLPDEFAVCRLTPESEVPRWAKGKLVSLTRTDDELSIVCDAHRIPTDVSCERGWRCLMVAGPLDFSLVGVIAALTGCLAAAGISVFVVSTYDTDYLLVKHENLAAATESLTVAGHSVTQPPSTDSS